MEQLYQCAHCGAENEIEIDPGDGDRQRLLPSCNGCGRANVINAMYNYHASEFDLTVEPDSNA
jgi:hypothetical protein